jgi:hypothetical protein
MPEDKIIISFDEEKPRKREEKIIVELGDAKPKDEEKKIKPQINMNDIKVNSFYKENSSLTSFSKSDIGFPAGTKRSFILNFSVDLNNVFLNSLLENNICIITSSARGNIYFIDKDSGKVLLKKVLPGESFEKTGFVFQNIIYLNSLNSIYKIETKDSPFGIDIQKIYSAPGGYVIWTNLNFFDDKIAFIEYSCEQKSASLKILDIQNYDIVSEFKFEVTNYISDLICIHSNTLFSLQDNKLFICDLMKMNCEFIEFDFYISPETLMIGFEDKLIINNKDDRLIYFDLKSKQSKADYSGISSTIINSIAGFKDNLFIGTANGWEVYKSGGMLLYNFEDISANKIEALNNNILVVSKQNRIVFHNVNKFQEAEGYTISSENSKSENDSISSVKILSDSIFVLTYNGVLKSFANDELDL